MFTDLQDAETFFDAQYSPFWRIGKAAVQKVHGSGDLLLALHVGGIAAPDNYPLHIAHFRNIDHDLVEYLLGDSRIC